MVRKSQEEMRQTLLEQKEQIEQRLKTLEAKLSDKMRKNDTRRKIIIGGLCLHHAAEKPEFKKWLADNLSRTIKPSERALFADFLDAPKT